MFENFATRGPCGDERKALRDSHPLAIFECVLDADGKTKQNNENHPAEHSSPTPADADHALQACKGDPAEFRALLARTPKALQEKLIMHAYKVLGTQFVLAAHKPEAVSPLANPRPDAKGAYYRKVMSHPDRATGIDATETLPTPHIDAKHQKLDHPSIYLGAHSSSGGEIDTGLAWEQEYDKPGGSPLLTDNVSGNDGGAAAHRFHEYRAHVYDADGKQAKRDSDPNWVKSLRPDMGYHPFYRYVTPDPKTGKSSSPLNYTDERGGQPLRYFNPGDKVDENFGLDAKGHAHVDIHEQGARAGDGFEAKFDAPHFTNTDRQFKRIQSIDQSGGESVGAQKTNSAVTGGGFDSVFLAEPNGPVPLTGDRAVMTGDPTMMNHNQYNQVFHPHDANAAGGEYLDIHGTPQIPYAAVPGGKPPAKR